MECPKGKLAALLSQGKEQLHLPQRFPESPVFQDLLLSSWHCRSLGTGRRPNSSCSDTSWQAAISCSCYAQTSGKRGNRVRSLASWTKGVTALDCLKRRPLAFPLRLSASTLLHQKPSSNSCGHGALWAFVWKGENVQNYFCIVNGRGEVWSVWTNKENVNSKSLNFNMEDSQANACKLRL